MVIILAKVPWCAYMEEVKTDISREEADLPIPSPLTFKNYFIYSGPTMVAIGFGIGAGELLFGPIAAVKYGLDILWIALVSIVFQAFLNLEYIRYTIATGEPAIVGYLRTKPNSMFWGLLYSILLLLQLGWPYLAFLSATALVSAYLGRLAGLEDAWLVVITGYITWFICLLLLLFGGRVLRMLEVVNWIGVLFILFSFLLASLLLVPVEKWFEGLMGLIKIGNIPRGADWLLLGSIAGYAGLGGMANVILSSWYKDKGFGAGKLTGYISTLIGGRRVVFRTTGIKPRDSPENAVRFKKWFTWACIDQYILFTFPSILAMLLPSILLSSLVEPGRNISGFGVAAIYADAVAKHMGLLGWTWMILVAFWTLFTSQISVADTVSRQITEIAWSLSKSLRDWAKGDVRKIYYLVLLIYVIWGSIVINIGQPLIVAMIAANIANLAFTLTAFHQLYLNHKYLPKYAKPSKLKTLLTAIAGLFYMSFFMFFILKNLKLI